jgi:hypothetical protein
VLTDLHSDHTGHLDRYGQAVLDPSDPEAGPTRRSVPSSSQGASPALLTDSLPQAGEYDVIEYAGLPAESLDVFVVQRFSSPSGSRSSIRPTGDKGVSDRPELKPRDSYEVGWIACVERQRVGDRTRRDERVIRARRRFAP